MNTANPSRSKPNTSPRRWIRRLGLGCLSILLGLPLLYYGYCWGVWGRSSLLLQYLFQCKCPAVSQESRYPDEVDVIISACRQSYVELSPSGRLLAVREEQEGITSTYLLDLQIMQRIDIPKQPFSSFLTDDLGFIESGLEDYIVDRASGVQYPIQHFRHWQENAYVNGEPNLELLLFALHQAEIIYFTQNNDTVIVLMPNFMANPEQNFTFDRSDVPGWDSSRVELFLQENNINYRMIFASFPNEVVSPNGRFIARDDGIYLTATNQMIAKAPPSLVRGWIYNEQGVIYSSRGRCLIQTLSPFADDTACHIRVLQPILLLKLPEEYLLPTETP